MRVREIIEERASRKFFEEQAQADRPVVLRSNDFSSSGGTAGLPPKSGH